MRWDLYLEQTLGSGTIALAVAVVMLGLFSWWYIIQKTSLLDAWRPQLTKGFWTIVVVLYLVFFFLLCFAWPT